jgi:hypothetical protein
MQPQTVAVGGVVTALNPFALSGVTYTAATGTFTFVTAGLYYISVTINTAATTPANPVFALIVNGGAVPAAPGTNSDAGGGQLTIVRVQSYAAGDTFTINNLSTFPVTIVNAPNELNSAGHVTIHRFADGPVGPIITG